ncbi:pentapeptide repeat-containing protein [Paracidovorax citrulli]
MEPVKSNVSIPPAGPADATASQAPGTAAVVPGRGQGFTVSHGPVSARDGEAAGPSSCQRFARTSAALWRGTATSPLAEGNDFRGASLNRADFAGAALYGADFRNAQLREADFRGARLLAVRFDGADLSRADLRDLDTPWANFSGCVLQGASISFGPRALQRMGEMSFLSAVVQSTASIDDAYRHVRAPLVRQIVGELRSRIEGESAGHSAGLSAGLSAGILQLLAGHRLFQADPAVAELISSCARRPAPR